MLLGIGVAGVPGGAFAESEAHENYMRLCIAREDDVLSGALQKILKAVGKEQGAVEDLPSCASIR
jgi:hypothetical protein